MSLLEKLKILTSEKPKIINLSLSQKIIFITTAMIIIGGVAGTILQLKRVTDIVIKNHTAHFTSFAKQVEKVIKEKGGDIASLENDERFAQDIKIVAETEHVNKLSVANRQGKIIAHTKKEYVGSKYTNPDIRKAIAGNKNVIRIESHTKGTKEIQRLDIAIPLHAGGKVAGALEAELPLTPAESLAISFSKGIAWPTILIAILIIPLMFAFLMRYVSHPIRDLLEATKSIAKGDLDVKVKIKSYDEIGKLAQSFNTMTEILKKSRENLEYRVKELSIVNEVSKTTSSTLDLEEILHLVLEDALKALSARSGSIMLLDKNKEELRIKVAQGLDRKTIKKTRVKLGEGISGWVAKEGEPLLLLDSITSARFGKIKGNTKDAICVPLKTKGKIIGVINISNKLKGTFNHTDVDLLSTLANEAAGAIENAQLFETLHNVYLSTIETLAAAVDAKDPYTRGHSSRVAHYSKEIAKMLGLSSLEVEAIRSAAYLHDIGKIGIPEKILLKGKRLNKQEYAVIQTHPEIAAKILSPIKFPWEVVAPIKEHHKHPDGRGYPNDSSVDNISLGGKIISVADAFDAMTSSRPYRRALSIKEAIEELERYTGKQFDKKVVKVFVKLLKKKLKKSPKPGG